MTLELEGAPAGDRRRAARGRRAGGPTPTTSASTRVGLEPGGYVEVDDQLRVNGHGLALRGRRRERPCAAHPRRQVPGAHRRRRDPRRRRDAPRRTARPRRASSSPTRRWPPSATRWRAPARQGLNVRVVDTEHLRQRGRQLLRPRSAGHHPLRGRRGSPRARGRDLHRRRGGRVPARGHDRRRRPRCRSSGCATPSRRFPPAARSGSSCSRSTASDGPDRRDPAPRPLDPAGPGDHLRRPRARAPRAAPARCSPRCHDPERALAADRAGRRLAGEGRAPAPAARRGGRAVPRRAAWTCRRPGCHRRCSLLESGKCYSSLREDPLRGRRTASPRSRSTTRTRATRWATSCWASCSTPSRRPRRTTRCAAWCSPPRTRRSSRRAATSRSSRPTCRWCTSTSPPSSSSGLFQLIGGLGKPTICAANGHVLAGSLGIALACDLIVAKDSAGFGTPEINVGPVPVHDHGADLPQRAAQEDQRDAAAGRAACRPRRRARPGIVNRVVPRRGVRRGGGRVGAEAGGEVARWS